MIRGKIRGQGVPRSEQIDFLAVKSRVLKEILSGDAHDTKRPVYDEIKSSGHRMGVAGGVGDQIKERTICDFEHSLLFRTVAFEVNQVFNPEVGWQNPIAPRTCP